MNALLTFILVGWFIIIRRPKASLVAISAFALCLTTGAVQGQSISLTGPTTTVAVPDGDEFGTDVAANPLDMNFVRDNALEYNMASPTIPGGIWTANGQIAGNFNITPLSPGFIRANYESYFSWYDNGLPYGPLNPLNASKYSRFSIRMSLNQNQRSHLNLYWSKDYHVWPSAAGNVFDMTDGDATYSASGQQMVGYFPSGFRIYDFNPNGTDWNDERNTSVTPAAYHSGGTWAGTIYAFTLWPSSGGPAGTQVQVDWMRMYDPTTSPLVDITWSTAGIPNDNFTSLQICLDSDSSGFNGDVFATTIANDGRYTLRTAALPAGNYYAYVRAVRHENSGYTVIATSGYSALIRVGQPPVLTFSAPSFVSGADYATTELANPWDMNDASDFASTKNLSSVQYSGGQLNAIASGPASGQPHADPNLLLNVSRNGSVVPLDTKRYRYATVRMQVNTSNYGDMFDRITRGWVGRWMWWSNSISSDGTMSKDIPLLEDWHSYTVDLWDNNLHEVASAAGLPQRGWDELKTIKGLRFDPLEVPFATQFWIDDIKICAENVPVNGSYTIGWNATDSDSSQITVTLFYGSYNGSTYVENSTAIATLQQAPGAGSYAWNTASLAAGRYYVRAEISDGAAINSYISKVPVVVGSTVAPPPPPPPPPVVGPTGLTTIAWGDYDGDGAFDLAAVEKANDKWWIKKAGTNGSVIVQGTAWGYPATNPAPGDYNGDGRTDLALFNNSNGKWYIKSLLSSTPLVNGTTFGNAYSIPAPGDYNGDGKTDMAYFDRSTAKWYVRTVSGTTLVSARAMGTTACVPVPGDYNNDGIDELALYNKTNGNWYIQNVSGSWLINNKNCGSANMDPVRGDFNGDGVSELGLWDRTTGRWYIINIMSGTLLVAGDNWGGTAMKCVPGDYNGDGAADMAMYDRSTGKWYIKTISGTPITVGEKWGN